MDRLTRTYKILLVLALAACAIVVIAEFHRHADDPHGQCWLCVSSYASIALPASLGLIVVSWTFLGPVVISFRQALPQAVSSALCARAPPSVLRNLSF